MKSPTYKVWPMISVFWYLPTYVMYAKILAHIYDHVQQFYSNCWTLYVSSLSEKTVNTLWHYEDHWYIFKKEEDLEETPAAPHIKALCFRVKSIYCYKLLSVREVGRKTTIGYILYSKKWKFMTPRTKTSLSIAFSIFSIRLITACVVENVFWNPNCIYIESFDHSKIPLAFYT